MAVYGYRRVSTSKQANEGESLDVQQRKLSGWGVMQGEELTSMFTDEGVSGSTRLGERKAGGEMLTRLKAGDTIVATKLDRLFRSSLDALQTVKDMQRRKIKIHIIELGEITGNGVAKVFMTIAAAFAEFEREQIAERVSDVKRDQRDRGKYLGGKVPFGFAVRYELQAGKRVSIMEPVPEEQLIISEVRKIRKTGKSLRFIQEAVERQHRRRLALPTLMRITEAP